MPNIVEKVGLGSGSFLFAEEEYGLVGGGVVETAKIQDAMNKASEQGRILILPPFSVTVSTLDIPVNGLEMWGQYGISLQPLSELLSTGINAPILRTTANSRKIGLRNFKVTGSSAGASQHGIHFGGHQSALFDIDGIYVRLCGGDGIRIEGSDYSYNLKNIYSTANEGEQFYIDAVNSPCVQLENCYAGVVKTNKYGFYIRRGKVQMNNCNSLDGGTPPHSCVRVGDSAVGVALLVAHNCNFESFTLYGVHADIGSDVQLYNCDFVPDAVATTQPVYLVQPTGKSFIDVSCTFQGGTYDNADNLPIKIYDRNINSPLGIGGVTSKIYCYWNSEHGRSEVMENGGNRIPAISVTSTPYTQQRPGAGYIGVNVGSAATINLNDPQDTDVLEGYPIVIKDESGNASANNITVQTVNSRNINGSTTAVINTNYGSIRVIKRNNQYWTI